ncbi:sigma factor [Bryobacter aggregatus]|uniref:sigma factor n=1 Tax=Bryobacter aggregatus TaxID=360054 RepID=UPI00138E172A|nr:sigma factor [Bryobacter aggregatus]
MDTVLRALQGDIYDLALRMLRNREAAEDAAQEILVRIVTRQASMNLMQTWFLAS